MTLHKLSFALDIADGDGSAASHLINRSSGELQFPRCTRSLIGLFSNAYYGISELMVWDMLWEIRKWKNWKKNNQTKRDKREIEHGKTETQNWRMVFDVLSGASRTVENMKSCKPAWFHNIVSWIILIHHKTLNMWLKRNNPFMLQNSNRKLGFLKCYKVYSIIIVLLNWLYYYLRKSTGSN